MKVSAHIASGGPVIVGGHLSVGSTIGGSPTAGGLLYADSSGNLAQAVNSLSVNGDFGPLTIGNTNAYWTGYKVGISSYSTRNATGGCSFYGWDSSDNCYVHAGTNKSIIFASNGSTRWTIDNTWALFPGSTYNLGKTGYRLGTVFATNLDLESGSRVALGGGAAPTLGTIGGSGPAVAAQNSWGKIIYGGTTYWVPLWV